MNNAFEENFIRIQFYTSYFGNIRNLPKDALLVSVAKSVIDVGTTPIIRILEPSYSILNEYKNGGSEEAYIKRYKEEILNKANPTAIAKILIHRCRQGGKNKVILLCYEKPDKFCHRHLIA